MELDYFQLHLHRFTIVNGVEFGAAAQPRATPSGPALTLGEAGRYRGPLLRGASLIDAPHRRFHPSGHR
jgi:hypothetical protein